jgi:cytochrome b6-f complex iron-sulfur subunit
MNLNRRDFLAGCAGCALALPLAGCTAVNPAPLLNADADGTVTVGVLLKGPGDQVKVRLPGVSDPVLVWRSDRGYGAASIVCTHRGSEVHFDAAEGRLVCPSHGSQFGQDGRVLAGPAARPLTSYRVEVDGERLTLRRV